MRTMMISVLIALAACERPRTTTQSAAVDSGARTAAVDTSAACDTAAREPTRYLQLTDGTLRIEAPVNWRLTNRGAGSFSFAVPDISGPGVQTEVYVAVFGDGAIQDLGSETDPVLAQITARGLLEVLADTMPDARHRYFWWHGQHRETSFSIFNDFGHAGGRAAHVMISVPLIPTPVPVLAALSRDTNHLLSTLTVDGKRVFPGWTMHPTVECISPAADDGGAPKT